MSIIIEPFKEVETEPHYLLTIDYMIGDADGDTKFDMVIYLDKIDLVEKFLRILGKLKPIPGHWGIILDDDKLEEHLNEGHITEEDYKFFREVAGWDWRNYEEDLEYDEIIKICPHYCMFKDLIWDETEYSFLVYEHNWTLTYIDEKGRTFNCSLD